MKELSWIEQIGYLANIKFPMSKAPPPSPMIGSRGGNYQSDYEKHKKLLSEIKSYEDELSKMSRAEVKTLYEHEKNKETEQIKLREKLKEETRFFNLDSAEADFEHWSKAAHWTLDEAIALSFGKSPDIVTWETIKTYTQISKFANEYAKRRDLAKRALPWSKLFDPMTPLIFTSWAKELEIELPADLISNVEKRLGASINWYEEYRKLKTAYENLNSKSMVECVVSEQISPQYKTSLLQIQNFAIKEFFEPRKNRDPKQNEVMEWIKSKGQQLETTVSDNIASAIFTIIKPHDHDSRNKRVEPSD